MSIVKDAGLGARDVATETYTKVVKRGPAAKKTRSRKAKRAVRKTKAKVRAKTRR